MKKLLLTTFLILNSLNIANANSLSHTSLNGRYYSDKNAVVFYFDGTNEVMLTVGANVCGMSGNITKTRGQVNTFTFKQLGEGEGVWCPKTKNMKIKILHVNSKTKIADKIKVTGSDQEANGVYNLDD